MKKFIPIFTILIFISIVVIIFLSMAEEENMVVVYKNNKEKKPIDIKLKHFQDTQCGMVIKTKLNSAQVVAPNGNTWFFDDIGCMCLWFRNISFKKQAVIWVYSTDTKRYIDGRKAWYTRVAKTPMLYGFGAYEHKQKGFVNFEQVLLYMLRGQNLKDPYVKQQLLGGK